MLGNVACTDFFRIVVGLVADGGGASLAFQLSAGDLADAFWVLLHILLPSAPRMPRTDELGMILESRWDSFASMGIALYKLNHVALLLLRAPLLEGIEIREAKGISVVGIARAIWLF